MENKDTPIKMDQVTAAQALVQVLEEASSCEPTNSQLVDRLEVQFSHKVAMVATEQTDSAHQDQHASVSITAAKAVAVAQEVPLTFVLTAQRIS